MVSVVHSEALRRCVLVRTSVYELFFLLFHIARIKLHPLNNRPGERGFDNKKNAKHEKLKREENKTFHEINYK